MLRYGALIAVAFAAVPANAQQMSAVEARNFVVGKHFAYRCFEGTRGAGRIAENGSVAGTIQFRGGGATRYAMLPANTLYVVGDRICATVRGVPFQPCFNVIKTSANTFRGSVSGLGFAYCDFVRRDRPDRPLVASAASRPAQQDARVEAEAVDGKPETTAAVPATPVPVEVKELPRPEATPAVTPSEDKPDLRSSKE